MPLDESIHTQIERQRSANLPEARLVKSFRDYAAGKQKGTIQPKLQQFLRGVTGNRFCDNVCKKALTEAANRLNLLRYDVRNQAVSEYLADLFVKSNLADLCGDVHYATLRDGNYAITLSWDNEASRVVLSREQWWNGETGIYVHYDAYGQAVYAVKDWQDEDKKKRRIVYRADRIERYVAEGTGWKPYQLAEDNGVWPMPWIYPDGSPIGIPVIHFANGSGDNDSNYGTSDLDGGLLGLQDEINDLQRDLTAAGRLTAFSMVAATGVKEEDAEALKVGPGEIFITENADAQINVLPAGDLSQLINQLESKLQTAARNSSTPLHLITGGDWPSGEALIRAEQPLVAKVEKFAKTIGPAWASVAHMATKLANVYGRAGLDEESLITAVFASVDRRDILTLAQVANQIAPHVSKREVLRIMGYSPERIDQIMLEREEESAAALVRAQQLAQIQQPQSEAASDGNGNNNQK